MSPPSAASAIALVSGSNQSGAAGQALAQPLVVKVTGASGTGVSGVAVTFAVTAGGGHLSATSAATTAQGEASVIWTLGTTAGTNLDTATASVAGVNATVIFVASAGPAAAAQLASSGGANQTAPAGTQLPTALSVQAKDAYGNPVQGVMVSWAVVTGGGSLSVPSAQTAASGVASVQLTLGPEPGPQSASGTVSGLTGSPVTFAEAATPNGTISGTITTTTGFLAPRPLAAKARPITATRGIPLAPVFAQALPSGATAAPAPGFAPASDATNDLIVTFRYETLGTPPAGSLALATAAAGEAVGKVMRSRLASMLPAGAEVAGVSPTILAAKIRVADPAQRDVIAASLRSDPSVAAVTRNGLIWLDEAPPRVGFAAPVTTPNDAFYPQQSWHYGLIAAPRAWSITTGSTGVVVAVVDNGIRPDHPDLAANITTDGYTFVNNVDSLNLCAGGKISSADNGHGYYPDPTIPASYHLNTKNNCFLPDTVAGHGVHVAGTIGAVGNNAIGVTGINWTVRIRAVRVLGVGGFGNFYDIAQGILYAAGLPADNGAGGTVQAATAARVINMSLGGPSGDTTLHSAVIAAANAGVLLVVAAGNAASSTPEYPAAYPEVLAVSAVGPGATLAPYSSYGTNVGIAAPGGDMSLGASDGVASTLWNFVTSSPAYGYYQGTSMATPHVTGVAALVLAQNPSLTAAGLRARLTSYAANIGPANLFGAGLVNAYNSLTQSFGPPTQLYARVYNAATGAAVQTVPTQAGGAYSFGGLADGTYDVYAGTDESADQQIGLPGRLWGAFGGSALPTGVSVAGAGTYPASFSIALPVELDPNNAFASANVLMIGGYIHGTIAAPSTSTPDDYYRVRIPQAGTYTFETSGWVGMCGFALEENTVLALYDASGTLLTTNDDIDAAHFNYCSRITTTLTPGTYYVGVAGYYGRRYRLQARSGT